MVLGVARRHAFGAPMNVLSVIGVYGALAQAAGRPFGWPGGACGPMDLVDARLLSRAFAWAAGDDGTPRPAARDATSTEVLRLMNGLVKNEKVRDTMREMSKEMMRGGLIEEMVNDAFEEMESDDLEAETETEVTAVLAELAGEQMAAMPGAETHPVAMPERAKEKAAVEQEGEEDVEIDALQARLDAIRQEAS